MKQFIGKQFAHYQLNALLGEGGMGVVYHALNLQSGNPVAVKIMLANLTNKPLFRQRFAQEAQTISNFNSPAIIKMYDAGQFEETPYLAMEFVEGGNLTDYLKQLQWSSKRMPLNELITLGAQIMEGLAYAHQRGIIHRDIKPDNILLKLRNGNNGTISQAVISDFGLALELKREDELATNPFMGSLAYMSPEQCRNLPFDGRSDIYSAGIMLYQLATGQLPFQIKAPIDIIKHVEEPPLPPNLINPELPQKIEDIILKAIAKRPSERFQTAAEMAHALRRASRDIDVLTAVPHQKRGSEVTRWLGSKWVADVNVQDRIDMNKTWITEGSYRLFVTNQYEESQTFSLDKDEIAVGRSHDNDIVLKDQAISAHHISLKRTMAGWQLRDLGSTNGSHIDDRSLEFNQDVVWKQHEVLRIGPYFLKWQRFDDGEDSNSQPTTAGVPLTPPNGRHNNTPNGRQNGSRQNGKPNGYAALPLATMATPPAPPRSLPPVNTGGQTVPPPVPQSTAPIEPLEPLHITGSESAVLHVVATPDRIELMPEIEFPMSITITNRDTVVKDINVRLFDENGRHPHWARLLQQGQRLLPGETAVIEAEIELPQNHNLLAGDHVLNVQVTTDRGETAVTPVHLIISAQQKFTLDMHPSNLQEGVICRVAINDHSNFDNEYTIVGTDDSDALLFKFQDPQNATLIDDLNSDQHQQQLKLKAGANAQASFTLRPRKRPWLSRKQVYPFKVHVQIQDANELKSEIGQVRINPRISFRGLLFFLLFLLLIGIPGYYVYAQIKGENIQLLADAQANLEEAQANENRAKSDLEAAQDQLAIAIESGDEAAIAVAKGNVTAAAADVVAAGEDVAEAGEDVAEAGEGVADINLLPVGINLDVTEVEENNPVNMVVGIFTTQVEEESASVANNVIIATSRKIEFHTKRQQQVGTFTYSLISGSAAFRIDGSTLKTRIAFDFETQNQYDIVVQTIDSKGEVFEKPFTIIINDANDAPSFSSLPLATAQEDVLYSYSVLATDPDSGDTAVITASSKPAWLTLVANGSNALLSGTPTNEDVGDHQVTLIITDSSGETDTQTFTITVANVNNSPVFDSNNTPAPAAIEDVAYSHTLVASDSDANDTLTISIQNSPNWLTLTNSGNGMATLSGTPTNDDVATYVLNLFVTDSAGATGTQVLNITVSNINDAPTFTSTPVENVQPTKPYIYNIRVADIDLNDSLTIVAITPSPLPNGLNFQDNGDGTATLSGTFDNDGTHEITLRVTDSAGATGTQAFTLVVEDVNDAPVIDDAQTSFTVSEIATNNTLVGAVMATDADGDNLIYTIISGNIGNAFVMDNKEIRVADTGQLDFETNTLNPFALEIRVTDDGTENLTDTATFTINVTDVNDEIPVVAEAILSVSEDARPGILVGTSLTATDADANTILQDWKIVENNDAGSGNDVPFDIASGQLSVAGALDFNTTPSYPFMVTVSDGVNTSNPVTITINILNDNIAPVLAINVQLTLSNINEDPFPNLSNNGDTVANILASDASNRTPIEDANGIPPIGIAIISMQNSTNGTWQYCLGTPENCSSLMNNNWTNFPPVSIGNALLLDEENSIRFDPNPHYHTDGSELDFIDFKAWDQSDTANNPGDTTDASLDGGSTPFSTAKIAATIAVASVPDNPIVFDEDESTNEDQDIIFDAANGVLANNDFDPDGGMITATISSATSVNGAAISMNEDGSYSYDPRTAPTIQELTAGAQLVDTFDYIVTDDNGGAATGTVTITVSGINDAPVIDVGTQSIAITSTTSTYATTFDNANITVTDVDSADFKRGTLTVTITGNIQSSDVLTVTTGGNIKINGNKDAVRYFVNDPNAVPPISEFQGLGAIISDGFNGRPLIIRFNKAVIPTESIMNELMQQIAFSTQMIGEPRTVEFILVDADGLTTAGDASDPAIIVVTPQ